MSPPKSWPKSTRFRPGFAKGSVRSSRGQRACSAVCSQRPDLTPVDTSVVVTVPMQELVNPNFPKLVDTSGALIERAASHASSPPKEIAYQERCQSARLAKAPRGAETPADAASFAARHQPWVIVSGGPSAFLSVSRVLQAAGLAAPTRTGVSAERARTFCNASPMHILYAVALAERERERALVEDPSPWRDSSPGTPQSEIQGILLQYAVHAANALGKSVLTYQGQWARMRAQLTPQEQHAPALAPLAVSP